MCVWCEGTVDRAGELYHYSNSECRHDRGPSQQIWLLTRRPTEHVVEKADAGSELTN